MFNVNVISQADKIIVEVQVIGLLILCETIVFTLKCDSTSNKHLKFIPRLIE